MALENKFNITDSAELAREEERISKKKAVELYDKGLLDRLEAGSFSALSFKKSSSFFHCEVSMQQGSFLRNLTNGVSV